ncbi:hypothetical protein F7725_023972 [Dissostichus mawsoni]|uniref:UmuC domain-containing protein n=1 Tax=Dissostichus mawsoni TaxID=36200 RepID=A0A7J5XYR7_DISMA|nr:hypothetical protein F7725_023972 [Dissostichus mawsoni]
MNIGRFNSWSKPKRALLYIHEEGRELTYLFSDGVRKGARGGVSRHGLLYVQVEQRLNPALKNTSCVVAQYKTWKGGGCKLRGQGPRCHQEHVVDDAKILSQICRCSSAYREASVQVIEVMSRFAVIERASIDEAYMDLTDVVQQRLKT